MKAIIVYVTAPNEEDAARIARTVVEERLCGCVNLIKAVRSIYSWMGKIEDDGEVLMIIKTRLGLFESLASRIRELHPYTVPEIIAVEVVEGSADYLKWLGETTGV